LIPAGIPPILTAVLAAPFPLPLAFFNVGGPELMMIMLLALMLFGGKKMPELARGFGKAMREFRNAASGVEQEIKRAMEEEPPAKSPPAPRPTTRAEYRRQHDDAPPAEPDAPARPATPTPPAAAKHED
jgi:sec-independent protein translocase protein TatA